ncbi:MAG: hypothetical protein A3E78_07830 [Alphaproteobacteria bacterium RIFCSPHIGHO2_12_FULL_63_12]|nr:MAG: hypothetical protein A3E78_07830 [Alphaproteobacteria bacterium RIFCSPHIGHO2_12_FULL_63_12]
MTHTTCSSARPSKWGNRFKIGRDGSREEVIMKYRVEVEQLIARGVLDVSALRGKRLGCYCAPLPCHGDVLAELLD